MLVANRTAASPKHPLGPYLIIFIIVALALAGLDALAISLKNPGPLLSRDQYLALGDSLGFGYQPNLNFTDGYVDDVYRDIHKNNVTGLVNYSCPNESSVTMINGNCPDRALRHSQYLGSQLDAAVSFLENHRGEINPVTFDMGANDVFTDFDATTCSYDAGRAQSDIMTLDTNLTKTILPQLTQADTTTTGARAGKFLMLNYYDPFAKQCPNSLPLIQMLNQHIAADAAQFKVPMVDIYTAFGGDNMANNICTLTWMCSAKYHDVHPTTQGYAIMAQAVEQALNLPGTGGTTNPIHPAPGLAPGPVVTPQGDVLRPRV